MRSMRPTLFCFSCKKALFLKKLEKSVDQNNVQKIIEPQELEPNSQKYKKMKILKFMWRGLGHSILVPKIKFLIFVGRSQSRIFNFWSFVNENDYFRIY